MLRIRPCLFISVERVALAFAPEDLCLALRACGLTPAAREWKERRSRGGTLERVALSGFQKKLAQFHAGDAAPKWVSAMDPLCFTLLLHQLPALCGDDLASQVHLFCSPSQTRFPPLVAGPFVPTLQSCTAKQSRNGVSDQLRSCSFVLPPRELRTGRLKVAPSKSPEGKESQVLRRGRRPLLRASAVYGQPDLVAFSASGIPLPVEGFSEVACDSSPSVCALEAGGSVLRVRATGLESCGWPRLFLKARATPHRELSGAVLAEEDVGVFKNGEREALIFADRRLMRTAGVVLGLVGMVFLVENALLLATALRLKRSWMFAVAAARGCLGVAAFEELPPSAFSEGGSAQQESQSSPAERLEARETSLGLGTSAAGVLERPRKSFVETAEAKRPRGFSDGRDEDGLDEEAPSPFGCRETAGGEAECFLRLPLTSDNVAVLILLCLLCVVGLVQLLRLALGCTRGCQCALCRGKIVLEQKVSRASRSGRIGRGFFFPVASLRLAKMAGFVCGRIRLRNSVGAGRIWDRLEGASARRLFGNALLATRRFEEGSRARHYGR